MPMVFPQEGPGFGSAALDALRKLGMLNASSSGSMGPPSGHRLTEQNNWSPPPATPPAEQAMTGLMHPFPMRTPELAVQRPKQKQSWAGEINSEA